MLATLAREGRSADIPRARRGIGSTTETTAALASIGTLDMTRSPEPPLLFEGRRGLD